MNSPINSLPLPQLCYHSPSHDYWRPDENAKWMRVTETSAKHYLQSKGFSIDRNEGLSEVDQAVLKIQDSRNVTYAAKLAGHDAGFYEISGNKVLVTQSPKAIEPKAGEWPLLKEIIDGMLNVEPEDQRPYFYGWLKRSMESYRAKKWMPGQVIAFAGPIHSGKSLLQAILTEIFGGRSAKPYLFLSGGTTFNADLFQAEHLMIEDECESIDFKSRRHFGAQLKQMAVNKTHQCHGKGKDGITLTPLWRVTISLNDDPERLLVLPPISDDIQDKVTLFKVAKKRLPMPDNKATAEEKEAFWSSLKAELPAFVDFILKYEIEENLRCNRFGVIHYHHPELLMALNETAPEFRLLELIDRGLFRLRFFRHEEEEPRELTALELQELLCGDDCAVSREARQLLTYPTACGSYLGKLAKMPNSRISKRILHGHARWTINPPEADLGGGVEANSNSDKKENNNPRLIPSGNTANRTCGAVIADGINPATQTGNILQTGVEARKEQEATK